MSTKKKWIYAILIFGSVLAAIKMIFWGYGLDEEYQIIMSYRTLTGDTMFGLMHEAHQTSSFMCTFFMWLYHLATGGYTGVVIWLRFCGTLIHLLLSVLVYRVAKKDLKIDNGFFVALIYFNLVPKQMMIPDFSNMQMWFFTLTIICLLKYFSSGEKKLFLVGCGLSLSLEVLAYPSMIIHFPLLLLVVCIYAQKGKVSKGAVLGVTCLISAALYIGYFVLRDKGISGLASSVGRIIAWDGAHESEMHIRKWQVILQNLGLYLLWLIAIYGVSFVFNKLIRKRKEKDLLRSMADGAVIISCVVQLIYWVIANSGYEYLHLHVAVTLVAGAFYFCAGKKSITDKVILFAGVLGTSLSLVGICLLTNLNLLVSMAHGGVGMVFVLMLRGDLLVETEEKQKEKSGLLFLQVFLCLTLIVCKGYTMRESKDFNNVLQSKAHILYGPAAGCITNLSTAQIYNRVYETWETLDLQDAKLLVVSASVDSPMNTWYMFDESQVCHYSIINPSFYDERLLTYWEMFPQKRPEVIAVECREGNPVLDEDRWIMQYIMDEFGYTEIVESYFVRIYRK